MLFSFCHFSWWLNCLVLVVQSLFCDLTSFCWLCRHDEFPMRWWKHHSEGYRETAVSKFFFLLFWSMSNGKLENPRYFIKITVIWIKSPDFKERGLLLLRKINQQPLKKFIVISLASQWWLKCGFCRKSFIMNAPLVTTYRWVQQQTLNWLEVHLW